MPNGKYADIIERLRPDAARHGEIVHLDGRVLGQHRGIIHYTIGQRKGLGLSDAAASNGAPLFVVRLDAANARVTVGPREALATRSVALRDINWIGPGAFGDWPADGLEIAVRVRSTRAPAPALLHNSHGGASVELLAPEDGVSPGQACVFYTSGAAQARVLGGGIIASTRAAYVPGAAAAGATANL